MISRTGSAGGGAAPPRVLITGAAGNLGSHLARHMLGGPRRLRLMVHRTALPPDLAQADVETVRADLARPSTLGPAVAGVDCVVHFAGVLFAARPERFLPETNTRWFGHLLDAALHAGVRRVVLVSFPHVEGPTTPADPATGRTDRAPISVHAQTRLDEERLLLSRCPAGSATRAVVARLGMVYGRGVLMIEAARWLARRRLLGVWRQPIGIQLMALPDALRGLAACAEAPEAEGIYHLGDERPVSLQEFLDRCCAVWGARRPWRMPAGLIAAAASVCEAWASVFGTRAPLTHDFLRIGQVPYWGDTSRSRKELLPELRYPDLDSGLDLLR